MSASQAETTPEPRDIRKVAIMGDSVAAGLGVRGRSFGVLLAEDLGAEYLQLARTMQTTDETVTLLQDVAAFQPDLVIVAVGGSDALIHPGEIISKAMDRFAPKSWQGVAGLEPRPFFTGNRRTRAKQRLTSFAKVAVKKIGIRLTGGYRRRSPEQFEADFRTLFHTLRAMDVQLLIVGIQHVDEVMFPRSSASIDEYNAIIQKIVAGVENPPPYIDAHAHLQYWDDFLKDKAHFNDTGHRRIADLMLGALPAKAAVPSGP